MRGSVARNDHRLGGRLPVGDDAIMLIAAGTVLTGTRTFSDGWIRVDGERIVGVGGGPVDAPVDIDLGADAVVVPGFVDMHVHGGGGGAFPEGTATAAATAIDLHRRHGTTTMVASLVSAEIAVLADQIRSLVPLVGSGELAGIHLEGPWLSTRRCGAHDPGALRDPTPEDIDSLLAAGGGTIRMVTLAPERTGAIAAIERLVAAGVVAAVGHTDATYEQVRAAIDAGATVGTHLFNAMRPVHHREPGPVIAMLEDERVTVELIADGVHLHSALYRDITHNVGPDRVALITDAMAAAGMPDGDYELGPLAVTVTDGVARVAGTETIAGSTATMDRVFRTAVGVSEQPGATSLPVAVRQTSINPARTLGLPESGLVAGAAADLVVLDAQLRVAGVLRRGEWIVPPP